MDIRKVKKLIELLEESGIAEIEIKEGEEAVRISRMPTGAPAPQYYAAPPPVAAAPAAAPAAAAAPSSHARRKDDENIVPAPMVGTYYAAASPTAKPFVAIGDEVKEGQVLCIIEAMKMMNQIESDRAGRVTAIMVKNGDAVEFGQPLFVVE
ncbi:MAG: acetyl-CoA carboxylase biotin carboxyl carrier protein [Proteobacteria bacterium]|jgi:acetyl-CoA carboxylase biotin carboxyl carrier protein|nr:acetyl-CoA carboxylase biotin carboxyl carrier protein [Pseudomonadota bacterium]MBK7116943.1 acetyl-CoA carboxylase biotin carboxyl carrier protein [Pseudomonadota bacterium]MCC6631674.1 acetyl-CoA carboxylase biotin carboxyl carrier protein [Gammaproteobacteria bacterium]